MIDSWSGITTRLPWLANFLGTKFHGPCPRHGSSPSKSNLLCYYCTNCMGTPFCPQCRDERFKHEHHLVLQVRKASEHSAIEVGDINKLLDASGIREFKINKKNIFHLYSRQTKLCIGLSQKGCCKICNWELQTEDLFCSIKCKLHASFQEGEKEPPNSEYPSICGTSNNLSYQQGNEKDIAVAVDTIHLSTPMAMANPSKRKRSRKRVLHVSEHPSICDTSNNVHHQQESKRDVAMEMDTLQLSIPMAKASYGKRKGSRKRKTHRSEHPSICETSKNLNHQEGSQRDTAMEVDTSHLSSPMAMASFTTRTKSRKGIPHRSHFF